MSGNVAARAKELALLFAYWPSITGSVGEAAFPHQLAAHLAHFDEVWVAPIAEDAFARSNIFAMRRGTSRRTIVLTGHFDVVATDDYGSLQDLAFEPEKLMPHAIARLKTTGENPLALADFESGDFLPGRGLLDMKAGLAAGLAAIEAYAGEATLLFVGVADEEEKSAGARAAVPQLKAWALAHGLDIKLVINLDAISDQGDGSKARVVTYGSIGKQLLIALAVGKQAHAGYPQDGVNAAYMMAELVRALELSPLLSEATGVEIAAPPVTLYAKDLKQGYNVTTPAMAVAYWNTMQHRRSGSDVLRIAQTLATRAMADVTERTGHPVALMSFADLAISSLEKSNPKLSLPEQSIEALVSVAGLSIDKPTVVLGFGSIPYPAVLLRNQALRRVIETAVRPYGLGAVHYFAGISDMSFFGEAASDLSVVAANTPIWNKGFVMPEPGGYPCINIGPWGRDYHQWLERLHAPYAFEVLPRVLLSVIDGVISSFD